MEDNTKSKVATWDNKLGRYIVPSTNKRRRRRKKKTKYTASWDNFYLSNAWAELRLQVLRHYGRQCMACGKTTGQMHVDHVKPRSKFPHLELEFDNMQVLCAEHNKAKRSRETWPGPRGKMHLDFRPATICTQCKIWKCTNAPTGSLGYCADHSPKPRLPKEEAIAQYILRKKDVDSGDKAA